MEFDEYVCGSSTHVSLKWEAQGGDDCSGYIACWKELQYVPRTGYHELVKTGIWFDRTLYPPYSVSWRTQMAAHEWGHNLGLDHHTTEGPCDLPGVMAYVIGSVCFQVPAGGELFSVECGLYYSCGWNPAGAWQHWLAMGAAPTGISHDRPEVAGHTHLVRTSGNDVWYRYWTGSQWLGWYNFSSDTTVPFTGNAVIANHNQQMHVAAVSSAKIYYKSTGGSWADLGKPTTGGFDGPIAITNESCTVQVVGIAQGDVWFKKKDCASSWSGWMPLFRPSGQPLGGSLAIATSAHVGNGLHHIVALRPYDSKVFMIVWYGGPQWSAWHDLGCCAAGGLAVTNSFADVGNSGPTQPGVHVAMIVASDVHVRCWESYCPGGWWDIGGAFQGPVAIQNYGEVHVVAATWNNDLYHRAYEPQ
jgi:hypothetical protein